jgi:hypothetical protein
MSRLPTSLVAAATLVGGFAVAQGTGVRPLGAAVLLAGLAWCVVRSVRSAGALRVSAAAAAVVAAFAGSHVLARVLPTWPSVLLAAAAAGAAVWVLVDRPAGNHPAPAPAGR